MLPPEICADWMKGSVAVYAVTPKPENSEKLLYVLLLLDQQNICSGGFSWLHVECRGP